MSAFVVPQVVTIEQARAHLRISDSASSPASSADFDVALKLQQATEAVIWFIADRREDQDEWRAEIAAWTPIEIDPDGAVTRTSPDTTVPAVVAAGILSQLEYLSMFRGGDEKPPQVGESGLLLSVERMVWRYREPVIA